MSIHLVVIVANGECDTHLSSLLANFSVLELAIFVTDDFDLGYFSVAAQWQLVTIGITFDNGQDGSSITPGGSFLFIIGQST